MVQKKITSFPSKNHATVNGKDIDDASLQGAPGDNDAIIGGCRCHWRRRCRLVLLSVSSLLTTVSNVVLVQMIRNFYVTF